MDKLSVSIIGSTGYTGQELVRILAHHPGVQLKYLTARLDAAAPYAEIFPRFKGIVDADCIPFDADAVKKDSDIIFTALPHGVSMDYISKLIGEDIKIIDLSADYRLDEGAFKDFYQEAHRDTPTLKGAVYGLTEIYRDKIAGAKLIANPGCYPTSALLALLPMLKAPFYKKGKIVIDAKSGTTGAGRKADLGLSFSEVDGSMKAYKVTGHAHKSEIAYYLKQEAGFCEELIFVPHLIPALRGILSTIYVPLKDGAACEDMINYYTDYYKNAPFVRIGKKGHLPATKDVAGTNYCDMGFAVNGNTAIIVSVIDNLIKGAAGEAVQNMNVMCGFAEEEGLRF